MQRYQKGIDFIKSFSDICQSHLNPEIPGPQEPDPPDLGLPLFRAPPRPHSRGTAAARLSCCRQTPELVQLLLSTCCMQSSELCVGLKKRQYPLGLPAERTTVHPTSQACLPSTSYSNLPVVRVPTQPLLSRRATGKRPRPWRRSTRRVAATSNLAPSEGPVPTRYSARNGEHSTSVSQPRGSQTPATATSPLPPPNTRARGRPGPHSRRAAVAVLISYGLDAAGACHSNVAALEAQVYAHHRHGARYSSGSNPGPAGETETRTSAGLAR